MTEFPTQNTPIGQFDTTPTQSYSPRRFVVLRLHRNLPWKYCDAVIWMKCNFVILLCNFEQVKTLLSNPCHYSFLWFVFQELNETSKRLVQSETSLEMQIKVYPTKIAELGFIFSLQKKTDWMMYWSNAGEMSGSITKESGKKVSCYDLLVWPGKKFSLIVLMKNFRGAARRI